MVDARLVEGHDGPAMSVIKVATARSNPAAHGKVGQLQSHGAMVAVGRSVPV